MPGTHPPQYFGWGKVNENIPPILLRTFGYSRTILVALRSLSLKSISFGYKTPPIRFSQAGGQSAHKARPPNLELALTPLNSSPRRGTARVQTPVNNGAKAIAMLCHRKAADRSIVTVCRLQAGTVPWRRHPRSHNQVK